MFENISTWFIALPIGAILGWVANRLLGPTADAVGAGLLNVFSRWWNKESEAIIAYQELEDMVREIHQTNGYKQFNKHKPYLRDRKITSTLAKHDRFMRRSIKKAWINGAVINSYEGSNIFFAGMDMFFSLLGKSDISIIYAKFKDNDQVPMEWWLKQVEERKPKLLSHDVLKYLRAKQD